MIVSFLHNTLIAKQGKDTKKSERIKISKHWDNICEILSANIIIYNGDKEELHSTKASSISKSLAFLIEANKIGILYSKEEVIKIAEGISIK